MTRRGFLGTTAATGALAVSGLTAGHATAATGNAGVTDRPVPLAIAARSPWMTNQVGLTDWNLMFIGAPRFLGATQVTPGIARRAADGAFAPFPGNSWNDWKPGDSGLDQFVYVNTLRIFRDNTVWVCDWGAAPSYTPEPGAQKLVQLDPVSGKILEVLRFNDEILPSGSKVNGLQIHGSHMYITDSGLGGLIYYDLATGRALRRLPGYPQMLSTATEGLINPQPPGATHKTPKSDLLQLTADGAWLYWAPPTGPFRRLRADLVRDAHITDEELAKHVEFVANISLSPGSGMDTLGNLYLSDADNYRFKVVPTMPHNAAERTRIIPLSTSSSKMVSPDDIFISADRRLYTCSSQFQLTPSFGNKTNLAKAPWLVFSVPLPEVFDGIRLGSQVSGRP